MTHEELITKIKQLPLDQQKQVLKAISLNIEQTATLDRERAENKREENGGTAISQQLYGILQFEGGPPTDEEVKDMIANYLIKKYY